MLYILFFIADYVLSDDLIIVDDFTMIALNEILLVHVFVEVTYDCTVVTGDVDNAGTDMKIMLSASGDKGTTTPVELEKASDRFERAREDNIRVSYIKIFPMDTEYL